MGSRPHVLAMAYPAQGHVKPFMKLARKIASHGINVTFVHTEFNLAKILAAAKPEEKDGEKNRVEFVSVPDGLEPEDDRNDFPMLSESLQRVIPGHLTELIQRIKIPDDDQKIACLLLDAAMGLSLNVGREMAGIKRVDVWMAGPGFLALLLHIPKLIEAGVIDGNRLKDDVKLSDDIPPWKGNEVPWSLPGQPELEGRSFNTMLKIQRYVESPDLLLCNTFYELDSSGCNFIPNILPIGPLLLYDEIDHSVGSFWLKDSDCLMWLDQQPPCSVIYVAFGSTGIFSQEQFSELAHGLELSERPFLWVVRSDLNKQQPLVPCMNYPDGFLERIAKNKGKIVTWETQEKVLAHPSISCFMSHCGWNSVLDGLCMGGVPFLCFPYFFDQFHNSSYIEDVWRVGLKLSRNENGIVSSLEIKSKIEVAVSDVGIRENAKRIQKMARKSVNKGGSSFKNFETFINCLKD